MKKMRKLVQNLMAVIFLAFTFMVSVHAQNGPCTPLAPPSWITVTNITSTSAQAQWEGVMPGAWYRVELKNLNSGLVEDLVTSQSIYRNYTNLTPGTQYQIKVQASSCRTGSFGSPALKEFRTSSIVIEDIANLNMDRFQNQPNQQSEFAPVSDSVSGVETFDICIYKVPDFNNIDKMEDVFHAYIQLSNNDFFEFLMVGSTDNKVHLEIPYLSLPFAAWSVSCFDADGNPILYPPNGVPTIKISHQGDVKMIITTSTLVIQQTIIPLSVTVFDDVTFYASSNNSALCAAAANKQTTSQSPANNSQALKYAISPNPFTDHLDLNVLDAEAGPVTIRVLDLAGRVQFETTYSDAATTAHRIDADVWLPGLYYLQIQTETGTRTEPVVKL
jgi:hypothetical protein